MEKESPINQFSVIVLGIIFDPKEKKILIGRRENDPHLPQLSWCFPGGGLTEDGEINKTLKEKIKEQTGLEVKNLGAVFAKTYEEKRDLVSIYFLCEAVKGEFKVGGKIKELKWVKAHEIEEHFKVSFHPRLKEYLTNIGS
ncbi:MAG: NUDIX domain-containing protein [Nanoarchaeota archaeon]|nr:NUDIX domain-containing protein [Nanoarchaeota archaeon]MBU2459409.1 NUDIX domain-containing protein [Nanoarchaeota archaeon]